MWKIRKNPVFKPRSIKPQKVKEVPSKITFPERVHPQIQPPKPGYNWYWGK
jgi:hypothetical protein